MGKHGFQEVQTAKGIEYRTQLTDPTTGRRVSLRAPSVAELEMARRRFREARAMVRAGFNPQALGLTLPGHTHPQLARLGEVWEAYLAGLQERSRAKAESYGRCNLNLTVRLNGAVRPLFSLSLSELTRAVMGAWLVEARRTGGRKGDGRGWFTIKTAWDYLTAAIYKAGVPKPWGDWRPVKGRPQAINGERPIMRSFEEARALIAAAIAEDVDRQCRGHYADAGARLLVGMLAGLRNAEIAGLGWDDLIDLDGPGDVLLTIRHQAAKGWNRFKGAAARPLEPPKGRAGVARERRQILEPVAAEVLRRLREEQRRRGWWRADGPVFGIERPRDVWTWRTSGRGIWSGHVRRWAKAAGLPDADRWVTHCLRHANVSLAFASGADPRTVQERVGHWGVSTTMGYYHRLGYGLARPTLGRVFEGEGMAGPALLAAGTVVAEPSPSAEPRILPRPRKPPPADPSEFPALAAAWVQEPWKTEGWGRTLPRPAAVTAAAKTAGSKAYQGVRYREGEAGREAAKAAQLKAYKGVLRRWERALTAARKARAAAE